MPSISLRSRWNYAVQRFGSSLCLEDTTSASPQAIRDWLFLARLQSRQYPVCSGCRNAIATMMRGEEDWSNLDLRSYRTNLLIMTIRNRYYRSSISRDSYEDPLGW